MSMLLQISGRETLICLAEVLLINYGRNRVLTQLVDTTRIHLLPSMNPDGFERSIEGLDDVAWIQVIISFIAMFRTPLHLIPVEDEGLNVVQALKLPSSDDRLGEDANYTSRSLSYRITRIFQ